MRDYLSSEDVLTFFIWLTFVTWVFTSYLSFQKVWNRRHIRDVADSISVIAQAIFLLTAIVMFSRFTFFNVEIDMSIRFFGNILISSIYILIALHFWLPSIEKISINRRIWEALKIERDDTFKFFKRFGGRDERELVFSIINDLALVDGKISDAERKILHAFATVSNIPLESLRDNPDDLDLSAFIEKCHMINTIGMSSNAVRALLDLFDLVAKADGEYCDRERSMAEELRASIRLSSSADEATKPEYEVIVFIGKDEQEQMGDIPKAFPTRMLHDGIEAVSVGRFRTKELAGMVRDSENGRGRDAVLAVLSISEHTGDEVPA